MSNLAIEAVVSAPCIPIVYGNIAFNIQKQRQLQPQEHPYKWTVFVRAPDNSDLSYAIEKVVFKLHETFNPPIREIREPPFQVSETGWGAFIVEITIHLRTDSIPPIRISHALKLFHSPGQAPTPADGAPDGSYVLSEHYDEIVFNTPPTDPKFRETLMHGPGPDPPPYPYQDLLTVFSEEATLAGIDIMRKWVADRTRELEDRYLKDTATRAALQNRHLVDLGLL